MDNSLNHACSHEAAHIVSQWLDGGDAYGTYVGHEDGVWWGLSQLSALPDESHIITRRVVGGLAELRVQHGSDWKYDAERSVSVLLKVMTTPNKAFPFTLMAIDGQGNEKKIPAHKYINFSDDLDGLGDAIQKHRKIVEGAVSAALERCNDQGFLAAVDLVAQRIQAAPKGYCLIDGEYKNVCFDHVLGADDLASLQREVLGQDKEV